ncbi:unnamed protein product, partial [marine sediment metagenome]
MRPVISAALEQEAYDPHGVLAPEYGDRTIVRAPNGTLYAVFPEWCNIGAPYYGYPKGHWGKVYFGTSTDGGETWDVITLVDMYWHDSNVSTRSPGDHTTLGYSPSPRITMKSDGTPVVFYQRSVKGDLIGYDLYGNP